MNELILKAVALFRSSPALDDQGIYRALVADGAERCMAARLVEFLPMAYTRLLLRNSGARFANSFERRLPTGSSEERPLSSEPIWVAALAFVQTEAEQGMSAQNLLAVASRSAEFNAANQLLNQGSKLKDMVFTPVLLPWPEDGPVD